MSVVFDQLSRTFSEFLLLPNLTSVDCTPDKVQLGSPMVRFKKEEESPLRLNIPFTSAIMQAVSDDKMAIALARNGGLSFIYGSQPVERQAEMVHRVKSYKAGFVPSDSNLTPDHTLADILDLKEQTGHSTVAITDDGSPDGKLLGLVTSRDYRISRLSTDTKIRDFMTPMDQIIYAEAGVSLTEANDIIWEHKLNQLPVIDKDGHLLALVFRKDYDDHKENPLELLDSHKRLLCGAGINTRDYKERVPALVGPVQMYSAWILPMVSPNGSATVSRGSTTIMALPFTLGRAMWSMLRALTIWRKRVPTLSKSVLAAAPSALPGSRRA